MTNIFNEIIENLKEFGSAENERHISVLWGISQATKNDDERSWANDLLLYCEGNENGPLATVSVDQIKREFVTSSDQHRN